MATQATASSGWAVMDRGWEAIQKKTFTRWCNKYLKRKSMEMDDMFNDFQDGLMLIALVEGLAEEPIGVRYNKKPKLRVQKVENVGQALKFMEKNDVRVTAIGPEDIVDGNQKLILGTVWTIISKWQIEDISMEELTAKEALLLWCQKNTAGYKDVDVRNFTKSWSDGLAFCALINKFRPNLLNYSARDKADVANNFKQAFGAMEKLDIAVLLDAEDMVTPDDRSVMTQVSELYHYFASEMKAETAARRVQKVLELTRQNDSLKREYLERTDKLLQWISETMGYVQDRAFDNTLAGIAERHEFFKTWKRDTVQPMVKERLELDGLYNSLQTKLQLSNRPPFVPPEGKSPEDVAALWVKVDDGVLSLGKAIGTELMRQNRLQHLVEKFDSNVAGIKEWAQRKIDFLKVASVGSSVPIVRALIHNHTGFEAECANQQSSLLKKIRDIGAIITGDNYVDSAHIVAEIEAVDAIWDTLVMESSKRKANLDTELGKQEKYDMLRKDLAEKMSVMALYLDRARATASEPVSVRSEDEKVQHEANYDVLVAEKETQAPAVEQLKQLKASMDADAVTDQYTYSDTQMETVMEKEQLLAEAIADHKRRLDESIAAYAQNCKAKEDAITAEVQKMTTDYENRTKLLSAWIADMTNNFLANTDYGNTLEGVVAKRAEFDSWKQSEVPAKATERLALDSLFNNLQSTLRLSNRDAYFPPQEMDPSDISNAWDMMLESEANFTSTIEFETQRQEKLKTSFEIFNSRSAALQDWCDEKGALVKANDIADTLVAAQAHLTSHMKLEKELETQHNTLVELQTLGQTITGDNFIQSADINSTLAGFEATWEALGQRIQQRRGEFEQAQSVQEQYEAARTKLAAKAQALMMYLNGALVVAQEVFYIHGDEDKATQQELYNQFVAAKDAQMPALEELKQLKASMDGDGIPDQYNYSEVTLEQIAEKAAVFEQAAEDYKTRLQQAVAAHATQQDKLSVFQQKAAVFNSVCQETKGKVGSLAGKGTLAEQKAATEAYIPQINEQAGGFAEIAELYKELEDENIAHLAQTSVEALDALYRQLLDFVQKQVAVIDAQILEKMGSQVSQEELESFQHNFNHFDKDNSNGLNQLELKGLLQSIGEDVEDEFCAGVMKDYGKVLEGREITFEEFVSFITKFLEDADTPDQTKDAFKLCAGDKDYVTEADLKQVFGPEDVAYLLETMPPKGEGYDYVAYTDQLYSR